MISSMHKCLANGKRQCDCSVLCLRPKSSLCALYFWHDVIFYPNVTIALRSDICCRKSVCCLSSVTFVCPTQGVETFGNISSPFCTLSFFDIGTTFYGDRLRGTPLSGALNARGIATYVTLGYLVSWWVSCLLHIIRKRSLGVLLSHNLS